MHVLVAGGAGFIGSHVCEALLARGHRVTCLDNFATGNLRNIDALTADRRFMLIDADVTEAPDAGADVIMHLASPASPRHYQRLSIETMRANALGTGRLLEAARRHDARFLFASTSEVYGDPLEHPQRETYWGNVNPNGPRACYDESKRFAEALTFEYRRRHNVNAGIVRIFNTYGPRMSLDDGRAIPAFVAAAFDGRPMPVRGDGTQTRSFCFVDDLVEAMVDIALDRTADGEVFNIGNPHEITVLELARLVADAAGVPGDVQLLPPLPDDPARRRPDITKVRERYGWAPSTPLDEGLRRTVAHFRDERLRERPAVTVEAQ